MKKSELKIILSNLNIRLEQAKRILKRYKIFSKTLENFENFISLTQEQTINDFQDKIELYEYLINKIKKENRGIK